MNFAEFVDQCQKLLAESPETGNLKVFNTSCLDDPNRFETTSICVGTVCTRGAGTNDERHFISSNDIDDESGNDTTEPTEALCVVIEAF